MDSIRLDKNLDNLEIYELRCDLLTLHLLNGSKSDMY